MNKQKHFNAFLLIIFFLLIAGNIFTIASNNQPSRQLVVVIDPGHGGKDPGAVNKTIREKDVVLGIGIKLGKLINENHPDVKVIFTRNTDVFIPLIERSRIANKNKADLFISIHANFCATPSTRGTETFVLGLHRTDDNLEVAKKENSVILLEDDYSTTYEDFDPNSAESYIMFENVQYAFREQSVSFAKNIQQQFKAKLEGSNRGVKEAGFLVLRQSSMPSVLVESGFISNTAEANYLSSEEGQQHIALSVFEAFNKFKSKNSSGGTMAKATKDISNEQTSQVASPKKEVVAENQKPQETKKAEIVPAPPTEKPKVMPEPVKEKVAPVVESTHMGNGVNNPAKNTTKAEIPPVTTQNGTAIIEKPVTKAENSITKVENPPVKSDKSVAITEKTIPKIENPPVKTEKSVTIPENTPSKVVNPPVKAEKSVAANENSTPNSDSQTVKTDANTNLDYFSVQIGANTRPVEPNATNFKGLKDVRREKLDKFYRYYVGNEKSIDQIKVLHNQMKLKFPQAFIVSYVNGKRIPLNIGLK